MTHTLRFELLSRDNYDSGGFKLSNCSLKMILGHMMGEISIPETKGDLDTVAKRRPQNECRLNFIHRTGTIKIN